MGGRNRAPAFIRNQCGTKENSRFRTSSTGDKGIVQQQFVYDMENSDKSRKGVRTRAKRNAGVEMDALDETSVGGTSGKYFTLFTGTHGHTLLVMASKLIAS